MKLLALTTTSLAGLVSFASAAGFHKVCRKPSADHAASANRQALEPSSASPSATDSGVQASASSAAVDSTASNAASGLSTGASASASAVAPVESGANAASYAAANESLSARGSGDGRMVFAHYMLVAPPHNDDYVAEMKLAKSMGVDAFAVNYGGWDVDFDDQDKRLSKMFSAAEEADFKLFVSLDMTSVTEASMAVDVAAAHADSDAQLYYKDELFLSTFQDGGLKSTVDFDWQSDVLEPLEKKIGKSVFFVPGTTSTNAKQSFGVDGVDGVLSWPHQSTKLSEDKKTDESFESHAADNKKSWMAGIAPWFFKHYSTELNWGNRQDSDIFVTRYQNLLEMDVDFIELVTWNDYGESSYFGAADTAKKNVKWAYLSHKGFREMGSYFNAAFKEGKKDVMEASNIEDSVFMFYRTQPYDSQGSEDDLPPPSDADPEDDIFIVSFLTQEADITLTNGGKKTTFTAEKGLNMKGVPFQSGSVHLKAVAADGTTIADKDGEDIADQLDLTNENAVCI